MQGVRSPLSQGTVDSPLITPKSASGKRKPYFEAILAYPQAFGRIMQFVGDFVDQVNISFSEAGLSLITVDQSHVALLELNLGPAAFTKYTYNIHAPVIVGVQVESFSKALAAIQASDTVSLYCDSEDSLKLRISRETAGVRQVNDFRIDQIMIVQDVLEIPAREQSCEVLMPVSVLRKVCGELKSFAAEVTVQVDHDALTFTAVGTLLRVAMRISKQDAIDSPTFALTCKEPHMMKFKYSLFKKVARIAKIQEAKGVLLSFAPGTPLSLLFQLEGMGSLNFYLAPLVDEE